MAVDNGAQQFGFLPAQVVADLHDIGNWKCRATAIDTLQKALRNVQDKRHLLPTLSQFVSFLNNLAADPNFKIAISSVQILGDLVGSVGRDIEPHLRSIIPNLIEKFTDSKILVRAATIKLLKKLMGVSSPSTVMDLLATGMQHTSWKVREQLVNTAIMAAAQHARDSTDYSKAFSLLSHGMSDAKDSVRWIAVEGMALLASRINNQQLQSMLAASSLTGQQKQQVTQRLQQPGLPSVDEDGIVTHIMESGGEPGLPDFPSVHQLHQSESSQQSSYLSSGGSRLPWELGISRPRPRPSQEAWSPDRHIPGAEQPMNAPPALSSVPAVSPTRVMHPTGARNLANIQPSSTWQQQQQQPSSSLQSHTSSNAMPVQGSGPSKVYAAEASSSSINSPNGDAIARLRQHHQMNGGSSGGGSLHDNTDSIPASIRASQQLGSTISKQQGSAGASPTVLSPQQHRSNHLPASSTTATNGRDPMAGSFTFSPSQHASTSYQHSPDHSVDQDSSASSPLTPSRVYKSLFTSTTSNLGHGADPSAHNAATSNQPFSIPAVHSNSYQRSTDTDLNGVLNRQGSRNRHQQPGMSGPAAGGAQQQTATHGSGLMWLNTNLDQDSHFMARQETFSPSKVELLANLKKRQIEKRANSSQLTTRPYGDDANSYDTSYSPSAKDTDVSTPTSSDGLHYGLTPFASSRMSAYTQPTSQLLSPTPKHTQVTSIGPNGISMPQDAHQLPMPGMQSIPSSPLSFLAARRSRGTALGPSPSPVDPVWTPQPTRTSNPLLRDSAAVDGSLQGPGVAATGSGVTSGMGVSPRMAALSRLTPQLRSRSADLHPPPGLAGGGTAVGQPPYQQHYLQPTMSGGSTGAASAGSSNGAWAVTKDMKPSSAQQGSFWEKPPKGTIEELSVTDLTPLQEPERSCRAAVAKMIEANNADRKTLDWQGQYEAFNDARRLVKHHPEVARASLHDLVRAAAPAVDQLRSLCVKNSLNLIQEMFVGLGRAMDRELDEVVPLLLKKAGEVSTAGRENWLAAESDRVLGEMCRVCGEQRVVAALTACAGHKSMHVRTKVASHLDGLLEMNSNLVRTLLSSSPQTLDRLFKTGAAFLDEGALEARVYGKRIIWGVRTQLANRQEFDRLVALVQPDQLAKKVMDVVEGSNGPPPPPSRGALASRSVGRQISSGNDPARPYPGSLGIVNGVLSGAGPDGAPQDANKPHYSISAPVGDATNGLNPPSRPSDPRRLNKVPSWRSRALAANEAAGSDSRDRRSPSGMGAYGGGYSGSGADGGSGGLTEDEAEVLVRAQGLMIAKDFRQRLDGLGQIQGLAAGRLSGASDQQLVALLDNLTLRITDSNSKVAVAALECLRDVVSCLRDRINLSLNTLVPALATSLGSTNDKVQGAAGEAADRLLSSCDPALLIQHFSHCVTSGQLRGKALVVDRLQVVLAALWSTRPQLVIKHGIPAAFSLLNDARGETKAAAQALLSTLADLMGPALMDHAAALQPALQQRVADIVNSGGSR